MSSVESNLERWAGVFPAAPTAFDAEGNIDETGCRAILEDNIAHGVHGFWNAGGTGEGSILDDQQRTTLARIVGETCRGRVLSIIILPTFCLRTIVRLAR